VFPSVGSQTFAFRNGEAHAGPCHCDGLFGDGFFGERAHGEASKGDESRRPGRQSRAFARARRRLAHEAHSHHSHRVMIGLIGLLAWCGAASGKTRGAAQSLSNIQSKVWSTDVQPHAVLRAFGAKPLQCADAPELYTILLNVCVRAGMERVPELFLLPAPGMNAYALGAPDNSCISVTEGLLRGLSRDEIAGILAHEVAHILHHDTGAMNWAAAIQGEIDISALRGIAELASRRKDTARLGPQALLLAAAPALARVLFLTLSRVRELAADAMALELIDHPKALAAALCKLEYFHTGRSPLHAHLQDHAHSPSLGSHPGTWERIANLA